MSLKPRSESSKSRKLQLRVPMRSSDARTSTGRISLPSNSSRESCLCLYPSNSHLTRCLRSLVLTSQTQSMLSRAASIQPSSTTSALNVKSDLPMTAVGMFSAGELEVSLMRLTIQARMTLTDASLASMMTPAAWTSPSMRTT